MVKKKQNYVNVVCERPLRVSETSRSQMNTVFPHIVSNYSLLNLEIQRSQYIRPKVKVHKGSETIQGRKLYEEIW